MDKLQVLFLAVLGLEIVWLIWAMFFEKYGCDPWDYSGQIIDSVYNGLIVIDVILIGLTILVYGGIYWW